MEQTKSFLNFQTSILLNVLTRLPPKTICQCRCVCKTFLLVISSPEFVHLHLSKAPESLLLHHIESHDWEPSFTILDLEDVHLDDNHHQILSDPLIQFQLRAGTETGLITVVGSINGLICLNESDNDTVYVCNPTTREYITLAKPNGQSTHPCVAVAVAVAAYGFGLGRETGEYKVVRISQGDDSRTGRRVSEVQIRTLGKGSWRKVKNVPFLNKCHLHGVFLNGNLHWWTNDTEGGSKFINCFDVEQELFKPFPSPPPTELRKNSLGFLGILRDRLCVCDNTSRSEIVVWVMKEYGEALSWCKEMVIEKTPILPIGQFYEVVYPMKVFEDGEVLFAWQESFFFSYHPVTKIVNMVYICEPNFEAITHKSSFVSLNKFVEEGIKDSYVYMDSLLRLI